MATIRVRFRGGVSIPEEPVDVPEGQTGVVTLESPAGRCGQHCHLPVRRPDPPPASA